MVALVTGGFGFLGRHVAAELAEEGWEVVAAGRPSLEIPSPEFDALLADSEPRLVVHCAGPASVPASLADPERDFTGSVEVLHGLLERLRGRETAVVLISSAAVYGQPDRLPVAEDAPARPISPYGFHRLHCELLLREHREFWGLRSCTLRVFSAYGEGLRRQIMWDICAQALGEGRVTLHGTGAESRDFVHAADVARAVALAAREAPLAAEAYNVGTGVETRLDELAPLLLSALESDAPVSFLGERRPGDPANWRADTTRIAALGFEPSLPVEEGAARFADWARRELAA